MSKILSPFDLASYSQLVDLAGTSPTTTDMRGTSVQGAQREWGALEYDSTLTISSTTKLISPFDLASYSQLIDLAGTSPTTTDMRGTSVIGTQREWGALEYDSTLSIAAAAIIPPVIVPAIISAGGGGGLSLEDQHRRRRNKSIIVGWYDPEEEEFIIGRI